MTGADLSIQTIDLYAPKLRAALGFIKNLTGSLQEENPEYRLINKIFGYNLGFYRRQQ
ncbi:MAG: hypothetical protein RL497_184 [Pseudomonadota bacterium]|jgi:hypothetical protein